MKKIEKQKIKFKNGVHKIKEKSRKKEMKNENITERRYSIWGKRKKRKKW